jgi:hypothetical protein
MLIIIIMPLAWLHDMAKPQSEELASQLGLKADGTLDDLRRRVKERWTAMESFLPSPSPATESILETKAKSHVTDSLGRE